MLLDVAPHRSAETVHGSRFVRYGALRVPRSASADFDRAVAYLRQDPGERSVIDRIEGSRSRSFALRTIHDGNDRYDPNAHVIYWDPHSALRVLDDRGYETGGRQSPALGLGHEMDHACEPWRKAQRLAGECDRNYTNAEERRVIRGSELHAARTLHESSRHNHDGRPYHVATPTSR